MRQPLDNYMASASLGTGSLRLTADTSGLIDGVTKGLAQAKDAAGKGAEEINESLKTSLGSLKTNVSSAISGISTAVTATASAIKSAFSKLSKFTGVDTFKAYKDEIVELSKVADNLNIPIGELQGLEYAAKKSGAEANELHIALRNLAETGEDVFKFADRIKDMPLIQQMQELSKLGRAGWRVRGMFAGGADELRKMIDEGKNLSSALSDADAKAVRAASSMMTQVKTITGGWWNQFAASLAPGVEQQFKGMRDFLLEISPIVNAIISDMHILKSNLANAFAPVLEHIKGVMSGWGIGFSSNGEMVISILSTVFKIQGRILETVMAIYGYQMKIVGTIWEWAGAAVTASAPIVDIAVNLYKLLVENLKEAAKQWDEWAQAAHMAWMQVTVIAELTWKKLGQLWDDVWGGITEAWDNFKYNWSEFFSVLGTAFDWLADKLSFIGRMWNAVITAITESTRRWADGARDFWNRITRQTNAGDATHEMGNNIANAGEDLRNFGDILTNMWGRSAPIIDDFFKNLNLNIDLSARRANDAARIMGDVWQSKYQAAGALIQGSKEALSVEAKFKTEGLLKSKPEDIARAQLAEQKGMRMDIKDVAAAVRDIRFEFEVI